METPSKNDPLGAAEADETPLKAWITPKVIVSSAADTSIKVQGTREHITLISSYHS